MRQALATNTPGEIPSSQPEDWAKEFPVLNTVKEIFFSPFFPLSFLSQLGPEDRSSFRIALVIAQALKTPIKSLSLTIETREREALLFEDRGGECRFFLLLPLCEGSSNCAKLDGSMGG